MAAMEPEPAMKQMLTVSYYPARRQSFPVIFLQYIESPKYIYLNRYGQMGQEGVNEEKFKSDVKASYTLRLVELEDALEAPLLSDTLVVLLVLVEFGLYVTGAATCENIMPSNCKNAITKNEQDHWFRPVTLTHKGN